MALQNKDERYAYLDQLNTEQLNKLLRADIESPPQNNEDVIFHILEVIEKRERAYPTGRLVDVDKAWMEFQQYYNTPEGELLSLYPCESDKKQNIPASEFLPDVFVQEAKPSTPHLVWKRIGIIAATISIFFALMIGAQAAGIDVFGALGHWTNEAFHFDSSPDKNVASATATSEKSSYHDSLQAVLNSCEIREDLAPAWYPDGFKMSKPTEMSNDTDETVYCSYSNANDIFFSIQIQRFSSAVDLDSYTFEKNNSSVEQYTSNNRTFYIFSNMDTITATWARGDLIETISGDISTNDIKSIIDSIGG